VRFYASRACSLKMARQVRADALEQRQRLAVNVDYASESAPKPCTYCGEDVTGRDMHKACAMRKARASRWTRGPYTARPTAAWRAA
jgi:hypothetical protein